MAIHSLPTDTVRTLGATQVITDPLSAIKELIDNALDAHTTSIAIELSPNTLDTIQVRDNGHGIPPPDRPLIAHPHCTSKLSHLADLPAIASSSLGFRGEALASLAHTSASLTITTRVEGEPVAAVLTIDRAGRVVAHASRPLPVGTLVRVAHLLQPHPVRRQTALHAAERTLRRCKPLLQAYAFARPHVRLALRVLSPRAQKFHWLYAPQPGGGGEGRAVADAACKVVGAACAGQCAEVRVEREGVRLCGFLPRGNAEVGKVGNVGAFVAVDARPVSAARGTAKQLVKLCRDAFRKGRRDADGVKELFVFLHIRCPPASYDANVEPAKDDVLFDSPEVIVEGVKSLLAIAYGDQDVEGSPARQVADTSEERRSSRPQQGDVPTPSEWSAPATTLGLEHRPRSPAPEPLEAVEGVSDVTNVRRRKRPREDDKPPDDRLIHSDIELSNPWVLSKLNAPLRLGRDHTTGLASNPPRDLLSSPDASAASHRSARPAWPGVGLPTPRPSSPTTPHLADRSSPPSVHARHAGIAHLLPSSSRSATHMPPPPSPFDLDANDTTAEQPPRHANPPSGTPLHMIPRASPARKRPRGAAGAAGAASTTHKPFTPPTRPQPVAEKVWFDHLEDVDRPRRTSPGKRPFAPSSHASHGLVVQGELGDLAGEARPLTPPRRNRTMTEFLTPAVDASPENDERHDKRPVRQGLPPDGVVSATGFVTASELAAVHAQQQCLPRPAPRPHPPSPHAMREISGNAARRADRVDRVDTACAAPDARPPRSGGASAPSTPRKVLRRRSSRLPLERVPPGQRTHDLVVRLPMGVAWLAAAAGSAGRGREAGAWGVEDAAKVTGRLHGLLGRWGGVVVGVEELGVVVREAFAARSEGGGVMGLGAGYGLLVAGNG